MHMKHKEKTLMSIPEAKVCWHKAFLEQFQTENIFLTNCCLFAKAHLLSVMVSERFTYTQVLVGCCSLCSCNEMLTVRCCLSPWTKDMLELQEPLTMFAVSLILFLLFHVPSIKGRMSDRDLIVYLNIFLFVAVL